MRNFNLRDNIIQKGRRYSVKKVVNSEQQKTSGLNPFKQRINLKFN